MTLSSEQLDSRSIGTDSINKSSLVIQLVGLVHAHVHTDDRFVIATELWAALLQQETTGQCGDNKKKGGWMGDTCCNSARLLSTEPLLLVGSTLDGLCELLRFT